jgi:hypothetical protein
MPGDDLDDGLALEPSFLDAAGPAHSPPTRPLDEEDIFHLECESRLSSARHHNDISYSTIP